jgi:hypothetical protein
MQILMSNDSDDSKLLKSCGVSFGLIYDSTTDNIGFINTYWQYNRDKYMGYWTIFRIDFMSREVMTESEAADIEET